MKKKVCFICSSGGHLEQIKQLSKVRDTYDYFYVLPRTKNTEVMNEKKYLTTTWERSNKIMFVLQMLIWFLEELFVYIKERPDVIISTGAANAVPMCLLAKFLKKKVIFIETFARITSPSKTGKLMYKYADLFIVQWKELLEFYPNAVYGGWIY